MCGNHHDRRSRRIVCDCREVRRRYDWHRDYNCDFNRDRNRDRDRDRDRDRGRDRDRDRDRDRVRNFECRCREIDRR